MKSGEMRHYVEFQKNVAPQSSMGDVAPPQWETQFSAFCAIEPIVGREYHAAQAVRSGVTHTIKLRYNSLVDETWRIKDGRKIYEFIAMMDMDTRNRELRFVARTGVLANG